MRKILLAGVAAFAAAATFSAPRSEAATISVSTYSTGAYNALVGTGTFVGEDFEGLGASEGEGEVGASLQTAVGTFNSLGGTGNGGTVKDKGVQPAGNTGTQLALRDGQVYGRENLVPVGGKWFLDSNDTFGMNWNVALAGGRSFSKVIFALSDASDVGAFLRISTGSDSFEVRLNGQGNLANGNDRLVVIDFGGTVNAANIQLANFKSFGGSKYFLNDGFSIDGIRVATVPVPAGALLLGTALVGIGAVARRRRRAA